MRDALGIVDLPSYAKSILYYTVMITGVLSWFVTLVIPPSERLCPDESSGGLELTILVFSAMVTHTIVYRRRHR